MWAQAVCHTWISSVFTLSRDPESKELFSRLLDSLAFRKKNKPRNKSRLLCLSGWISELPWLLSYLTLRSAPAIISCPSGHGFNFSWQLARLLTREIHRQKLPGVPTRGCNTNLFESHLLFGEGLCQCLFPKHYIQSREYSRCEGSLWLSRSPVLSTTRNPSWMFSLLWSVGIYLIVGLGNQRR